MKKTIKTSEFGTGNSEVFVYPSRQKDSKRVILLLKGIYGYHFELDGRLTNIVGLKWDQAFVSYFLDGAHVICVNTSRKDGFDQSDFHQSMNSFENKTFEQEVDDVYQCFREGLKMLESNGVIVANIHLVGKSFGGTTFLGLPDIVAKATSIVMLGSGCGRKPTTTKPLLLTLFDEERLLQTIRDYKGYFVSYRGELDQVTPAESQEKLVKASGARFNVYTKLRGVDHQFDKENGIDSIAPNNFLRRSILDHIILSEKEAQGN